MAARVLVFCSAALLLAAAPGSAKEQSWSKRTPLPVKFAPPPVEQKQQDWSGVYVGVHGGTALSTGSRSSVAQDGLRLAAVG